MANTKLQYALSLFLSFTEEVWFLLSQKEHMSTKQTTQSSFFVCIKVVCLRYRSKLKWTVLLKTWMQLVSWKSGNTLMQMVRTVLYIPKYLKLIIHQLLLNVGEEKTILICGDKFPGCGK